MMWRHRLQFLVDSKTRNKGAAYYRDDAVHIESGDSGEVRATVQGGTEYLVEIRVNGNAVRTFCECPHYMDGHMCKHIWAVVLAAEDAGHLGRVASQWNPRLEHGLDAMTPEDAEIRQDAGANSRKGGAPPPPPEPVPPRVEPWQEDLRAVRRLATAGAVGEVEPPRRIVYVIDIDECRSSGRLVLLAGACRLKRNGEWGKPNFQEHSIRGLSSLDPADQRILSLLTGTWSSSYSYSTIQPSAPTRFQPLFATLDVLLPMICATGRFFMRADSDAELTPLVWDDSPPWVFRLDLETGAEGEYLLAGVLVREDRRRPLSDPMLLVEGLVFFPGEVARFDTGGCFEWVSFLRRQKLMKIPVAQRSSFIKELAQFPAVPPFAAPGELGMAEAMLQGPPHLKIRTGKRAWNNPSKLECEITFDYGAVKIQESDRSWAFLDENSGVLMRRDKSSEAKALGRAIALGMKRDGWNAGRYEVAPKQMSTMVRTLVSEGWRVEAEGKLYRQAGELKVQVASGIDWFELQGTADFEGQSVGLPELLKTLRKGDNLVRLDDGSYGLVPEQWLKRYGLVAGLGESGVDSIRFTRGQAGLLDALLADRPEVTFDEGFARVRRELETFAGVQPQDPEPAFLGRLREYQREGLGWLRFLRRFSFGGCLADDMGLGKTIQILALLDSPERRGPALVVVPRSLVFNWKQEAARFTPSLRVLDFTGAGRKDRWKDLHDHDLILTTYGTMRRDATQLKDIRFDTIVLDEAQAIKNASTEAAKAARLLDAEHRLALTGTPIENRIADLWSLFEFLNPGLLGNAAVFRTQTAGSLSEGSAEVLSKALRPFILRRTKEQVARELPAKTEQTIYCELESGQRKLYNELRDHYRAALLGQIDKVGIGKSRMQVLEALLRLRQAACHPGLIDKRRSLEPSAKLDALIPQLQEVTEEGHKALVFSQFTSFLTIVRARLESEGIVYEYLDGRTRDREARVKHFQEDPSCMLFLISLKAGGLGLNLTAAEYVFLLDPWWNPAVEAQAIDRAHRIGQSRQVIAYRLIARDTVEEKVLDLQKSKRDLADAIITADNSVLASLDRETLATLLS